MMQRHNGKIGVLLMLLAGFAGLCLLAEQGQPSVFTGAGGLQNEAGDLLFPVVEIRVSGNRLVNDALFVHESGLDVHQAYSEKQLQLALRRIQRLPFVLSAEISLERGPSYGTFAVRFAVEENKALFFNYERLDVSRPNPPPAPSLANEIADSSFQDLNPTAAVTEDENRNYLNLGTRLFIGRFAFIYGSTALASEDGRVDFARGKPVDIGFSHYNLFGWNMFLNLNVQFSESAEFENFDPWTRQDIQVRVDRDPVISVAAALPLRGQHWLTLNGRYLDERQQHQGLDLFVDRIALKRLSLEAGWLREAVNDAVFPTRGRRHLVSLAYIDENRDFEFTFQGDDFQDELVRSNIFDPDFGPTGLNTVAGLFARAEWDNYHPFWRGGLSAHQRVSLLAKIHRDGSAFEVPLNFGVALTAGLSYDLWGARNTRRLGDLRLEGEASYVHTDLDEAATYLVLEDRYHRLQASLAFRNAWGLLRLSAAYRSDALPVVADRP